MVGLHQAARRIVQLAAVHEEVGTLHGDARALVHHVAREAVAAGDGELRQLLVVALVVERHAPALHLQHDFVAADGRHDVGDAPPAVVRQIVGHEVSALVGGDGGLVAVVALGHYLHLDAGHAGAVVHAHIAAYATAVSAGAWHHVGLRGVRALAVADGHHLVFVVLQGRDGLVLIAHLVHLGRHDIPVVAATLQAAQHLEIVHHAVLQVPREHHAALPRLREQRLRDAASALVVEVGQRRRVDIDGYREGNSLARDHLPAGAEGHFCARTGHADDGHGVAAAVLLPLAGLAGVHTREHGVLVGDVAAVLRQLLEIVGGETEVGVGPLVITYYRTFCSVPMIHGEFIIYRIAYIITAFVETRLLPV